ncbi:F-box domain-containing protein [Apiospora kogelbergensis]|uniref:F-box domain-containing protein n=1 Tax=Apiospora kogelbergensis TaxID=1337665 RepID=UPI00312DB7F5
MKFTVMKLFRRSKKSKSKIDTSQDFNYDRDQRYPDSRSISKPATGHHSEYYHGSPTYPSTFAPWLDLPIPVLQRIFTFVCPHTQDETYENCEQSALEDACMLCDQRDLAHAGMVCKQWRKASIPVMYHSIRIDSVHYCEREIFLSDKRKRNSRWDRNGVPEDPAGARLTLLCRTLRDDPTRLGKLVRYLKTPYMLRESRTSHLARTIAVLPNLRYVDLPDGFFEDEPAYTTLKFEVQARCPDLRKMTFKAGSERSLEALSQGTIWPNLEVLDLIKINVDPAALRHVLTVLPKLRALKITDSYVVDDDIFQHNDMLPAFPPLIELDLVETPRVTSAGLAAYLSRREVQLRLKVLSIIGTGVRPQSLQDFLSNAHQLQALSMVNEVESAFPSLNSPIPPLANFSLETLRYEITASPKLGAYAGMTHGYYNYLAQSLFAGAATTHSPRQPSNPFMGAGHGGLGPPVLNLNQTLEIYTKGDGEDIDWSIVKMDPIDAPGHGGGGGGRRGHARTGSSASTKRPLSSYGLADAGANWREGAAGARRSVVMANGTGGFLAVPEPQSPQGPRRGSGLKKGSMDASGGDEWPRPMSSSGGKGDRDLWR